MKREFLQGGLRHFSEPRVLELLLFYLPPPGRRVNPWPTACWRPLAPCPAFWTPPRRPGQVPGVGENTVVLLKLIPAVAARYLASRTSADVIISDSASLRTPVSPLLLWG